MDDNLLDMFVEDTKADLAEIEAEILDFKNSGPQFDPEVVYKLFRTAHAIKGSASLLGLNAVRTLSHRLENVLDMVRNREMALKQTVIEAVVSSFEMIGELVDDIEESETATIQAHLDALNSLVVEALPADRKTSLRDTRPVVMPDGRVVFEIPVYDLLQARKTGNFLYLVEYDLLGDVHKKGKTPLDLLGSLEKSGLLLDCRMDTDAVGTLDDEPTRRIPLYVFYATILEEDLVRAVFQVEARYIHTVRLDEESGEERAAPLVHQESRPPKTLAAIDKDDLDDMEAAFDESLRKGGEMRASLEQEEDTPASESGFSEGNLVLTGDFTIERAAELKALFLQALDTGQDFTVDLAQVEVADVTFLQVLWAAYKSAEQRGFCITLSAKIPESLKEMAARAGFADMLPECQGQPDFPLMGLAVEG